MQKVLPPNKLGLGWFTMNYVPVNQTPKELEKTVSVLLQQSSFQKLFASSSVAFILFEVDG